MTVILICLFGFWVTKKRIKLNHLQSNDILIGLAIKLGFAIAYLLVFTFYFSEGNLVGDTARFLNDSYQLNGMIRENPLDFLRLLLGYNPVNESSIQLLNQTSIWAVGPTADWINDNKLILVMNALIHFISFGNVYVHGLVFGFLSFIGIVLTYQTFEPMVANKRLFWFVLIASPNLAFWGTGLLKESLFIFGFGLWCSAINRLQKFNLIWFMLFLPALLLLIFNKPYAGIVIIGFTLILVVGKYSYWSRSGLYFSTLISLVMLITVIIIPGKLSLTSRLSSKQNDLNNLAKGGIAFVNDSAFCVFPYHELPKFKQVGKDSILAASEAEGEYKLFGKTDFHPFTIQASHKKYAVYLIYSPSGSYIQPKLINNSVAQLLKNTNSALVNVFIRPLPTDSGDKLKILNFVNNISILILALFAVVWRRKLALNEKYIVTILLGASIVLALIIGWSVPIFGAIVRYKIPVELLVIIAAFILLKPLKHEIN